MLGENIRAYRSKLNLSQEELAGKLETSANTIARWERGEVEPRASSVVKLSEALNVDPNLLLLGAEKAELPIEHRSSETSHISAEGRLIYHYNEKEYLNLPDTQENRQLLADLLKMRHKELAHGVKNED